MIVDEEKIIIYKNKGCFKTSDYFKRLFPVIVTNKPGKDFYLPVTLFLFLICIYIGFFYDEINYVRKESQSTDVFDIWMVLFLSLHVVFIILERYVHRSEQKIKKTKKTIIHKNITSPTSRANQYKS